MSKWVMCQNCHGNGTVTVEVKPGKWETQTCGACGGSGKVNSGLV
jgi:DnaJ-class molecular chaperone